MMWYNLKTMMPLNHNYARRRRQTNFNITSSIYYFFFERVRLLPPRNNLRNGVITEMRICDKTWFCHKQTPTFVSTCMLIHIFLIWHLEYKPCVLLRYLCWGVKILPSYLFVVQLSSGLETFSSSFVHPAELSNFLSVNYPEGIEICFQILPLQIK